MKLGINIGYSGASLHIPIELVLRAEAMGYDSVWTAEAYGSDAVTPLAYLAAKTTRIKLGTAILQIPARTPAMCAMTMSTLDALSGGRALVGLGLSGPQVVEGWHGVPYGQPAARTREYVEILRKIWARDQPVSYHGQEYQLPYTGPGATGLGKPLKSILHGRQLPVYLATMGPVNIRTTAELADGWLPIWFSPKRMNLFRPHLEDGFARALFPFVASIERVLAPLPLLDARKGAHQIVRIAVVKRWTVPHDVDLKAHQHRQSFGQEPLVETLSRSRLEVVRANLDDSVRLSLG